MVFITEPSKQLICWCTEVSSLNVGVVQRLGKEAKVAKLTCQLRSHNKANMTFCLLLLSLGLLFLASSGMALGMAVSVFLSSTLVQTEITTIGWIVMKCGSDIHVPLRLNCNNFSDPLTFHRALYASHNLNWSNRLLWFMTKYLNKFLQHRLYFVFSANQQMLAH